MEKTEKQGQSWKKSGREEAGEWAESTCGCAKHLDCAFLENQNSQITRKVMELRDSGLPFVQDST